jgi:hypothetical protein
MAFFGFRSLARAREVWIKVWITAILRIRRLLSLEIYLGLVDRLRQMI